MHTLRHTDLVVSFAVSPDGKRIVSGSGDGLVKIWDAQAGAEVSSFVGVRGGWRGDVGVLRRFRSCYVLEVV